MSTVRSVTPAEFARRWPGGVEHDDVVLLDVREPMELELASLPFATWIPMSEIPSRLGELDRSKTIVVMCHSGMRSMRVAQYLADQGFQDIANLTGGIEAWSIEIDHSIPRY